MSAHDEFMLTNDRYNSPALIHDDDLSDEEIAEIKESEAEARFESRRNDD